MPRGRKIEKKKQTYIQTDKQYKKKQEQNNTYPIIRFSHELDLGNTIIIFYYDRIFNFNF